MDYNERVGERLRAIRVQLGMSLQDVHRDTGGEFKAAVLGAYERGERAISVPRLHRLASWYRVPIAQLLPDEDREETAPPMSEGVTIDLSRVEALDSTTGAAIDRFLKKIQIQRQDFNGRVLTIRGSDVALLATLLDLADADLVDQIMQRP
ncbi:MAG: helix-turn-helix domain-containing protein [Acidimicrobiia bacterium]